METQPAPRSQLTETMGGFPDQESPPARDHRTQVPGDHELSCAVPMCSDVQPDPDRVEVDNHLLEALPRHERDAGGGGLIQQGPAQRPETGQRDRGEIAVGVLVISDELRHLEQHFTLAGIVVQASVVRGDVPPARLGLDPAPFPHPQGPQHQRIEVLQWAVEPELQAELDGLLITFSRCRCGKQPA